MAEYSGGAGCSKNTDVDDEEDDRRRQTRDHHDDHDEDDDDQMCGGGDCVDVSPDVQQAASECETVFKDFLYRRLTSRRSFQEGEEGDTSATPPLDALDGFNELEVSGTMDDEERQQYKRVGNALQVE